MGWRFWRWKQRDNDLREEIAYDLAADAEERIRSGAPREEAEHESHRDFGNVLQLQEGIRETWAWTWLQRLMQDLRYGFRTLRKNRLFASMAVLSLALGIGANTAIFSFMDAILMRTLPVRHPAELVILNWHTKGFPRVVHGLQGTWFQDPVTGWTSGNFPFPAFEAIRANDKIFSGIFAFAKAGRLNLIVRGQADLGKAHLVSANFFGVLGVRPAAGRLLESEDDHIGAAPVAVISHGYWQRRFAGSSDAIGRSILINNTAFRIVGVSAPEFFGIDPGDAPDLFLPLHTAPLFAGHPPQYPDEQFVDRNLYWAEIMGRMRPGVSLGQAQTELAGQFQRFVMSTAANQEERADAPTLVVLEGSSGVDSLRRQYSKPLYLLLTMVGLILAITCANIANLLLARGAARRREIAVRLSLGAGRLRVTRQLLTESLLLASVGGVCGVGIAALGIRFITALLANGSNDFTLHADLNGGILGFTFVLTLITGILFGLIPAIQATRVDVTPALKEVRATSPLGRIRLGKLLVVGQVAVSLLLTIAAGLFVRTLFGLRSVELGFDRDNVLLFHLDARQAGYRDEALARFYMDLWERFRVVPGVRAVTLSDFALVSGAGAQSGVTVPGMPAPAGREAGTSMLTTGPTFFSTMHIPILLGREVQEGEMRKGSKVAVVNEVFAKKYFAHENPLGRRFGLELDSSPDIEVIGVAKAARYQSLKQDVPPVVFLPFTYQPRGLHGMSFEIRTAGDPLALSNLVREMVHQVEPRVPISNINTQSRLIDQTINQERTFAQLGTCFAVLALVIACVGLYGTMAYAVARRTGEIGIRMALGAERRRIIRMVLREVVLLAAVGLTIGLALAWATMRYLESFLFGLKPNDPIAMLVGTGILVAALVLAGYAPATRASRIDPLVALRHE